MRTLLSWLGLCVILALSLAISACDRSDADESPEIAQLADVLDRLPPEVRARLSPFQRGIPGRWREVREDDPEFLADVERLSSLGYAAGVQPADGRGGAHTFDASRVQPGLSFWTSGHAPEAILSDLEGRLVHTWHATYDQVFPDSPLPKRSIATDYWRAARLLPDGSVVAIFEGLGIFRVDSDSRVRWAQRNGAHHDFAIAPDGTIWALVRDAHLVPRVSARGPILEDSIAVLDPRTGEEKRRFSLLEAFERGPEPDWTQAYYAFWKREGAIDLADSGPDDIFHTNSIEILDDTLADVPGFRPGNLLVSMRNLDMIAVVDPERESVVWSRAGLTTLQHDPSVTPDGALLVFDNQWQPLQRSRVVWLDPRDDSVRREWAGTEASPLYSHSCGTSQLLANGNVLVVETDQGRVLEVAPDDEIVWEFRNPHRAGEHGEYIASVFGMTRVPRGSLDWLAGS